MSKIEGSQTCVYMHNVSDEKASAIKIDAKDNGGPLPDSKYITIRKTNSLVVAEIEVFGGKILGPSLNTKTAEVANTVDLDEVAHDEPPHLELHYLPSSFEFSI